MTKTEAKELERAIKRDLNTHAAIREALGRVDIWVEQQRTRIKADPTFYVVLRRQNALAGITTYPEWQEYLTTTTGVTLPLPIEDTAHDVQSLL